MKTDKHALGKKQLVAQHFPVTYEQKKKMGNEKLIKRFLILVFIALVAFVIYVVHNSRCLYYSYVQIEDTEDNSDVYYEEFKKGYINYSGSGIEYQSSFGEAVWNESITLHNPIFAKSEDYVLIADMGSSKFYIFNEMGKVNAISLKKPILQACISDQGICEVIIKGDETNQVQVYNKSGDLIVDAQTSIGEMGYPLTAAISPDGTKLAISCYSLKALDTQTTIAVYDLSKNKIQDNSALVDQVVLKKQMVPKLQFLDDEHLVACADQGIFFYNIGKKLKVGKEINLESKIQSVFVTEGRLGVILDNTDAMNNTKYKICIYDETGSAKMKRSLNMSYEKVDIRKNQLFAIHKNECTIMTLEGRILFQGAFEGGGIATIIPAGGWRTYHVLFHDRIVKVRLQFWQGKDKTKEARK